MKKEFCIMPENPFYSTYRKPYLHRHEVFLEKHIDKKA